MCIILVLLSERERERGIERGRDGGRERERERAERIVGLRESMRKEGNV